MAQKSSSGPPPSYSQAVHGGSSSEPEPTGVYGPSFRGPDVNYVKSVGGIAKIVEMVSIVCLITQQVDVVKYIQIFVRQVLEFAQLYIY